MIKKLLAFFGFGKKEQLDDCSSCKIVGCGGCEITPSTYVPVVEKLYKADVAAKLPDEQVPVIPPDQVKPIALAKPAKKQSAPKKPTVAKPVDATKPKRKRTPRKKKPT